MNKIISLLEKIKSKKVKFWFYFCVYALLLSFLLLLLIKATILTIKTDFKSIERELILHLNSLSFSQQKSFIKQGKFMDSIQFLELIEKNKVTQYNYSIDSTSTSFFIYAVPYQPENLLNFLFPKLKLKTYSASVFLLSNINSKERITVSVICKLLESENTLPPKPILINGVITCPNNTITVYKSKFAVTYY